MAISDILFDAVEEIREWLKEFPATDSDEDKQLEKLLKEMDRVRAMLDAPPKV